MTLGTTAHSANTTPCNGNRPYDDLDSDDDLGREDITFPSDAGLSMIFYLNYVVATERGREKKQLRRQSRFLRNFD